MPVSCLSVMFKFEIHSSNAPMAHLDLGFNVGNTV